MIRGTRFDKTVSVGDVLQILIILGALALGFTDIRRDLEVRLTALETKVDPLWQEYTTRLRTVLTGAPAAAAPAVTGQQP